MSKLILQTFKRYELKYVINQEEFEIINHFLKKRMDYAPYCVHGNRYNIYNVYYDTEEDEVIRHSLDKPYYKEKLRLRVYDIPHAKTKVFIELKKKIGGIVNKRRTIMPYEEALSFIESPAVLENSSVIDKQVQEELQFYLKKMQSNLKCLFAMKDLPILIEKIMILEFPSIPTL